jgi:CheY-like chemotaxis protein
MGPDVACIQLGERCDLWEMTSTHPICSDATLVSAEMAAEREEILRHKWLESEKAKRDIGFQKALMHWMSAHHRPWLLHRETAMVASSIPVATLAPGDHRPKVLLVDDDRALLEILEMAFQDAGYTVQCAEDGLQGLRQFEQTSWDLVVTDRSMPQMDGEEMAKRMRAQSLATPIILITGLLSAVKTPSLFDALVVKPFLISSLLATVRATLQRVP